MLHNFAKFYSVLFMILSFFIGKISLRKKTFFVLWLVFVCSLSIMAYNVKPLQTWDIVRYGVAFDQIRSSGITFFDFVFKNVSSVGNASYTNLISFNILRYFAVHISDNNYFLTSVFIFIDYCIFGYIVIDWSTENESGYKFGILTLLLNFSLLPLYGNVSGMRHPFASCIMGLAVYLYIYKKRSLWLFLFLSFIAITIHPAAIITIPFVFLAKMEMGVVGFVVVLVIPIVMNPLAKYIANSSYYFIAFLGKKYLTYTADEQYRGPRTYLYFTIIICIMFLLIYFLFYRRCNSQNNNVEKKTIYNFVAIYMMYILGNIGNYDMVIRPARVFAVLVPVLISFFTDKKIWSRKGIVGKQDWILQNGIMTACFVLCCIINYKSYLDGGRLL